MTRFAPRSRRFRRNATGTSAGAPARSVRAGGGDIGRPSVRARRSAVGGAGKWRGAVVGFGSNDHKTTLDVKSAREIFQLKTRPSARPPRRPRLRLVSSELEPVCSRSRRSHVTSYYRAYKSRFYSSIVTPSSTYTLQPAASSSRISAGVIRARACKSVCHTSRRHPDAHRSLPPLTRVSQRARSSADSRGGSSTSAT